jgi:hypothetical protein
MPLIRKKTDMRITLLAVMAIVLAGCGYGPRDLDNLYVFAKHDSTGLCFFGEDWNSDGMLDSGTAGEVPCTPEVEKWIVDHRRVR